MSATWRTAVSALLVLLLLAAPRPRAAHASGGPNSWTATGTMVAGRTGATATPLPDGTVLVAGGLFGSSTAEVYNPTTGAFTATGSMETARGNFTATLLPAAGNRVLVTGGLDGSGRPQSSAELYDPATGAFTPTGAMTDFRAYQAAALLQTGQVLVVGGCNTASGVSLNACFGILDSAELYDPATGAFTSTGAMNVARAIPTATLLPNGKVLIAGGEMLFPQCPGCPPPLPYNSAELYDPSSGTFTPTGSMTTPRAGHSAIMLPDGEVLVVGGCSCAGTELYNPASGTWQPTGALPGAITGPATLLPNGQVLVAGGGAAAVYNPATGLWSATASPIDGGCCDTLTPLPNGQALATTNDGSAELYTPGDGPLLSLSADALAFGIQLAGSTSPAQTVLLSNTGTLPLTITAIDSTPEYPLTTTCLAGPLAPGAHCALTVAFAPAQTGDRSSNITLVDNTPNSPQRLPVSGYGNGPNIWTPAASLLTPRWSPTATLLPNGTVLVAGGQNCTVATCTPLASAELYEPATDTFIPTGSMTTPRSSGQVATLLTNGTVLVAGGCCSLSSAELFDPTTGTWMATGAMSLARSSPSATLLPNGQVLFTGGCNNCASAEVYNPATGTFTATGSLLVGRYGQTATLLPSGKVLIAGGWTTGPITESELYDPSTGTFTATGSMLTPRGTGFTATLLHSGKVLVVGGCGCPNAEVYDPASGTWSATGATAIDRNDHTATLLPNGRVLVTGGDPPPSCIISFLCPNVARTEIYDPATGTWTTTNSLATGRSGHTATLLPNGDVLVAGGVQCCTVFDFRYSLSDAETYTPVLLGVTPGNAVVGQSLTITGAHFFAHEPALVYWDATRGSPLAAVTTAADGSFTATAAVPQAIFGLHTLIALGETSGVTTTATVQVLPRLILSPASGVPGALVTASGLGFGAAESVDVRWKSPNGALLGTARTNSVGSFTGLSALRLRIPLSPPGRYLVYAGGQSSGARAVAVVTVY